MTSLNELKTIRLEKAAQMLEEQARVYAERADVPEEAAEHVAVVAGVIADSIRHHEGEHDEDREACPECGNLSLLILGRRTRRVLLDVANERNRQYQTWGDQKHDPFCFLSILGEEVGEAHQAALHDRFGGEAAGALRTELLQVAAVAVQMIELIDRGELK